MIHKTSESGPVGVFGGTFDPIHFGHLRLAEEAVDAAKLSEVRFLPSGTPPHRPEPAADSKSRVEMVRLGIAGNERFRVDDRETRRSGPAYTFDTLTELRRELGESRSLVLLLGADAFLEFATWYRWRAIFDLAHILVAYRPGFAMPNWSSRMPEPLAKEYAVRSMQQPLAMHHAPAGGIAAVAMTALDISASAIRNAFGAGRSVRYLLPQSVVDYIQAQGLYIGSR